MTLRTGTLGEGFANEGQIFETVYDFDVDAGATGDFVMTAGASGPIMVKLHAIKVDTAVTSAGAAAITVKTSDTDDAFLASEGKASFAIGAVVLPDTAGFVKLAADATLVAEVETADLTAGKLRFVWEVRNQ